MVHWGFAYRQARRSHWEQDARDRQRFKRRIDTYYSSILNPVFGVKHRNHMYGKIHPTDQGTARNYKHYVETRKERAHTARHHLENHYISEIKNKLFAPPFCYNERMSENVAK